MTQYHDDDSILDTDCFEDTTCQCPACGGDGEYMGSLGALDHLKCRDCGCTFHNDDFVEAD